MSTHATNRVTAVLALTVLLLGGALAWETWGYFRLHLEAALAEEQTRVFEEARTKALQGGISEASALLEYVTIYYPSGSKQRVGSHLDTVVERYRNMVIHDISQYLRQETGEDLGDKPASWIQRYGGEQ